jgi:hypothetical protein
MPDFLITVKKPLEHMLYSLVSPGVHNSMTSDFNGAVLGQGLPNGIPVHVVNALKILLCQPGKLVRV